MRKAKVWERSGTVRPRTRAGTRAAALRAHASANDVGWNPAKPGLHARPGPAI
jgi:hypothetical protein